jgi:hypothetical protein
MQTFLYVTPVLRASIKVAYTCKGAATLVLSLSESALGAAESFISVVFVPKEWHRLLLKESM